MCAYYVFVFVRADVLSFESQFLWYQVLVMPAVHRPNGSYDLEYQNYFNVDTSRVRLSTFQDYKIHDVAHFFPFASITW